MSNILHVTSGDIAGGNLRNVGLPGEVFVWHDILYEGPRCVGWPDDDTYKARAEFIEKGTGGGLNKEKVLKVFREQYQKLAQAVKENHIILWFDACLFDQSMLAHILMCLRHQEATGVELICVDSFPGIEPFNGLGQLEPRQLASLYDTRLPVTDTQYQFAVQVDRAFAAQDIGLFNELAGTASAPLPWVPAAIKRWLQEQPDPATGLGRLESMTLAAVRAGCDTTERIHASVAAAETPPQYWGNSTLWGTINALADRTPPLVQIAGPADRLPQWESDVPLNAFRITPIK